MEGIFPLAVLYNLKNGKSTIIIGALYIFFFLPTKLTIYNNFNKTW